jgi:phosphopantothenoylcysteine decarboxylase/phosphopantothenate--cysteine ligase
MAATSRRILVTAGPTHEPIDAVRYIANRSSGAMGLALASAAAQAGHRVTLLLGPVDTPAPMQGIGTERFVTSHDLTDRLVERFAENDLLIMAAAVADYRPAETAEGKLPRGDRNLVIELEPVPDLVAGCAARKRPDQRICAFALEPPEQLLLGAEAKLWRKGVDAMVANPLQTMGADTVDATVIAPGREPVRPGSMSKVEFARWLIHWLDGLFE